MSFSCFSVDTYLVLKFENYLGEASDGPIIHKQRSIISFCRSTTYQREDGEHNSKVNHRYRLSSFRNNTSL